MPQLRPKRLFIVDAMAMAFRSYYAFGTGRPLTTSSGLPVSAIFGTALLMNKLIADQRPDYLAVAADSREPTFRHKLYDQYKANRSAMPEDLAAQLPAFFKLLEAYGCPVLRQGGLEADDLIGTLARRFAGPELHVYIVSGDKDFMQLVSDHVFLYRPKKGDEAELIDRSGVRAKFGVDPEQVIDCLALIGDTSDNVPGVHGIGEKGAAKLIADHGSLDGIYAALASITNKKHRSALEASRNMAYLSQLLVTIKTDVELPYELWELACEPARAAANARLLDVYNELEFRNLAARVVQAMASGPAAAAGVATAGAGGTVAAGTALGAAAGPAAAGGVAVAAGGTAAGGTAVAAGPAAAGGAAAAALPSTALLPSPGDAADQGPRAAGALQAAGSGGAAGAAPLVAVARIAEQTPGYRLANDRAALDAVVRALAAAREFVLDTETTGLDLVTDKPIGISLSVKPGEAWYVPLAQKHLADLSPGDVLTALGPLLAAEGRIKIGHHIKFDLAMLESVGIRVAGPFVDTMVCDWLLESGSRQHGLDACCLRHLAYAKIPTTMLIGDKGQFSMLDADLHELTRYACEDADLTLRLYHRLLPQVIDAGLGNVLREVEMPLVPVLSRMERLGVHVDPLSLGDLSKALGEAAAKLDGEIQALAGGSEPFNVNSPKQLAEVLFTKLKVHEQLGIKRLKKTATGFSTDESMLRRLAAHPLPAKILEYRTVAKLKGTYADALPQLIKPASGRIHTSFHQTGTATGRLSSSDPNLQNIPIRSPLGQEIRKAFKPAQPGWVILSADYSQIELRMLAHLAGEAELARAFAEKTDIHRATAAKIFGIAPADVDQTLRARAKAINFGIIYGMGARRLALDTDVTLQDAAAFIERYFETYPGISRFIDATVAEARRTGYTRTVTGRRRAVPGLDGGNQRLVVQAENIAVNTRIQGSAADLIKLAMIAVDKRLAQEKLETRLLLQVHDELVFEAPRAEAEKAKALIRAAMEGAMQLTVPLDVAIGVGANWLEAH